MSTAAERDEQRRDALDAAARHATRLIRAVGWLRVLAEPGREPRPAAPLLGDVARERIEAEAAAEARDRRANLRAGLTAMPAGAVPVRLPMLTAQTRAVRQVARLVRRAARVAGVRYGQPVELANLVDALDWLAGDGGPACWAVDSAGVVQRRGVLADLDLVVVDQMATALREAADDARAVAGITEEHIAPYPNQPCPACRRRSLQIDATLRDPRYWSVRCISESCLCSGPGCPCFQRVRVEGRQHAWSYGELSMLEWAQARRRQRHPVRSGAAGHGGWAERREGEKP